MNPKTNPTEKERVNILSPKDLEISYYCGSGPGGQARNKVASGVQMRHEESGAVAKASDSRSQHDNKISCFKRLLEDPRMKFWIAKKIFELRQGETLEQIVANETTSKNLKFEIKNADGKWEEVDENYFETAAAKGE